MTNLIIYGKDLNKNIDLTGVHRLCLNIDDNSYHNISSSFDLKDVEHLDIYGIPKIEILDLKIEIN